MKHSLKSMPGLFPENIKPVVDPNENLEGMVRQIICDMEETLCKARQNEAEAMDTQKKLEHQLKQAQNDIVRWEQCAQHCLKINDGGMASRALGQKNDSEISAASLNKSLKSAAETCHELEQEIKRMGKELDDIKRKALDLGIWQNAA
ncbi:MAG: PspA/IM30 family protein [Proteobacteria bacterium]|nr:PspA/IM30 family protein [Pseudomonadota bacterium]